MTQQEMTELSGQREASLATALDRPLLANVRINWETLSWIGLLIVAAVLRFVDLGTRAMSHDESLHTL